MNTIHKINQKVNTILEEFISFAKRRRFLLMVEQFSLKAFSSINAAGRASATNRHTGESRARRAIMDTTLAEQLQSALIKLVFSKLKGFVFCSLDHSQFGPFCIAIMAVSFRKGRALPIWCQVNISKGAKVRPLVKELEVLFQQINDINPDVKLTLVMDRWFASNRLFTLFEKYGIYFISRTKSDKMVRLPWETSWESTPILEISLEEVEVEYAGHNLRLIRSTYDEEIRKVSDTEPWFLMTNLPTPSRKGTDDGFTRRQILNRYAERFEIEEAFKDIKWLNRLEWQRLKKADTIFSLLTFVFFGRWLLWWIVVPELKERKPLEPSLNNKGSVNRNTQKRHKRRRRKQSHPKKRISWFLEAWEYMEQACRINIIQPLAEQGGIKK